MLFVSSGIYKRHTPESTLLHRVVRDHLETFFALTKTDNTDTLPRYVEQEFRKYVRCGVLAHGFARARCKQCGADILVAFSCKRRGLCPSCGARRMANTSAHLVDHVLPDVPIRQWVLSMPFDLQFLVARDPHLLTAVLRILVDVVSKWHTEACGLQDAKTGAVSFVQRFGSALNLHVHFHILALDGVYVPAKHGESLVFQPSQSPAANNVHALTLAVLRRVRTLLKRRGLIGDGDLRACADQTPTPGLFANLDSAGAVVPSAPPPTRRRQPSTPNDDTCGFSIDASVRIKAGDFDGRERLCRYGARHPFSIERLSETADGHIAYKMKKPRAGKTFLILTPVNFLRRLASLVPPPFYPLLHYHGVLAPNSPLRRRVVRVNTGRRAIDRPLAPCAASAPVSVPAFVTTPAFAFTTAPPPTRAATTSLATLLAVTTTRLSRIEWATLLKRVYDVDALRCPRCDGRLEFIAVLTEPAPIRAILDHLGLPSEPPRIPRARDPTHSDAPNFFDTYP
ncbi:MAG: transposase [Opitutae bacterium]|nr:transposase [Opitutae bacterium]